MVRLGETVLGANTLQGRLIGGAKLDDLAAAVTNRMLVMGVFRNSFVVGMAFGVDDLTDRPRRASSGRMR